MEQARYIGYQLMYSHSLQYIYFFSAIVCSHAVKFMHDQKLTHTDLKPGIVQTINLPIETKEPQIYFCFLFFPVFTFFPIIFLLHLISKFIYMHVMNLAENILFIDSAYEVVAPSPCRKKPLKVLFHLFLLYFFLNALRWSAMQRSV